MHAHRLKKTAARPAFTLMELMVSVAILLAVLALIGTIFSTTSKAGGNATAVTTVYRQLRQAGEIIRQDLERMDPSRDALGVAGVIVPARSDRRFPTSIAPHRADVLMLITERRDTRPVAYQDYANPDVALGQRMQVVYGHADTAQFNGPLPVNGTVRRIEGSPSDIPAYDWHLARRTVLFPSTVLMGSPAGTAEAGVIGLTADDFLLGNADVTRSPQVTYDFLFPAGVFRYRNGQLAELYLKNYYYGISWYSYEYRTPPGAWRLYREDTGRWHSPAGGNTWTRSELGTAISPPLPAPDPPPFNYYQGPYPANGLDLPGMDKHFYNGDPAANNRRTVIDTSPRRDDPRRLAPLFLPNCSDFRVEFTYDDPRDVNLQQDPLDRAGPSSAIPNAFIRPIRWQAVASGEQWFWSKITAYPSDRTHPDRWPTAIRITLRAWDAAGRLQEPVTYTLIHAWPSGD